MRLKTYIAPTMQDAMRLIREEIGDDAVIISSAPNTAGKGISVTVAQDEEPDDWEAGNEQVGKTILPHKIADIIQSDILQPNSTANNNSAISSAIIEKIAHILAINSTPQEQSEKIISCIQQNQMQLPENLEDVSAVLASALAANYNFSPVNYDGPGTRTMLIGTAGAGKTLTAVKMAARITKAGHTPIVISTDYKKAGSAEQLTALTNVLGARLYTADNRIELKKILADCPSDSRVIIDSASSNPYDFTEMKELAEFAGLQEIQPVLIYPAGGDPAEATEIANAFSYLGVERIIITRLDFARRYGGLLALAHAANFSFAHFTGTDKILGDFTVASAEQLANLLLKLDQNTH